MTTAQKIIKYMALAFAAVIIINIFSGILIGLGAMATVLGLTKDRGEQNIKLETVAQIFDEKEISSLKMELSYSNLTIKTGETLKLETSNSNVKCTQNNNKLVIQERTHMWNINNEASETILYIPENMKFDDIDIDAGAGEINIESLEAKKFSFEVGAGKVTINKLNVDKEADIEGGAGSVSILSGTINNLDLNMGVGEFNLKSELTGKSDIDAGIGKVDIELEDGVQNYTIKASKGIGSISINNEELTSDREYGNGPNYIKIDGGVGTIRISE